MKIGSPSLVPLHITLRDFDGSPSQSIRVFTNLHITLGEEFVLIDVEAVDPPLDYKMLLEKNYMYAMKVVVSSIFVAHNFPMNKKRSTSF